MFFCEVLKGRRGTVEEELKDFSPWDAEVVQNSAISLYNKAPTNIQNKNDISPVLLD